MDEASSTDNAVFHIEDHQIFKIKLALSSLSNSVIVCPMMVNMYTMSTQDDDETWTHFKKGVPVVIMNKSIVDNIITSVNICLADPHSGFALWKEALQPTSKYKATQKNFHTFHIASSDLLMAGIRFPVSNLAEIFLKDVLVNVDKLENRSYSLTDLAQGERDVRSEKKTDFASRKKILKTQISRPCMFTHVTSAIEVKKDENVKKGVKIAKVKQK